MSANAFGEKVYPLDDGEREEVEAVLVKDFVSHSCLFGQM
jgi:hypothetical protein